MLKRLVKLLISLTLRGWDLASQGLVGRRPTPTCVALYYHSVDAAQRRRFALQMDTLLRLTRPIAAGQRPPLNGCTRYSAVTFDDGFVSVVENALPELEQRNIPATLFIPTGSLGASPAWVRNPSAPAARERVMSEAQISALRHHPLVSIGSHTVSHPNLARLDDTRAAFELAESRAQLEAIVGRPVTLFSFPHGAYTSRTLELARASGYERVFTIAPQRACLAADSFILGRVAASPGDWPLEFQLKLLGAYRWQVSARS
jgi:peptidoglycan/xylan/chitin deacetylase (PgdA/CDA1 family)